MEHIAMILRKPPYGDINAAEAVRHALGAAVGDMKVSLLLIDGGVQLARRGQDDTGTGFTNLESTLKDCKEMGVGVFADHLSLIDHNLKKEDLVEGVEVTNESDIVAILRKADTTMIF
ncbi:MAG TPA: DsrE family protein [Thermodesulfovibrionales bacterium]|nr:DsrE family protein [Thermodesulfovibrionales bacterium]